MALRKIIQIDEEKCTGCGECVPSCAEGAIQIIDGKAKLVSDNLCDGLGACLGDCPEDALTIIEREADDFDEHAVQQLISKNKTPSVLPSHFHAHGGACPSARVLEYDKNPQNESPALNTTGARPVSALRHWPVKLKLIPPGAPFLKGADLVLAADCVGFAFAGVHSHLLPGKAVLIGCPKFDDFEAETNKLAAVLSSAGVKSLTVAYMEVPCCHGYVHMARRALAMSGKDIPLSLMEFSGDGKLKDPHKLSMLAPG